MRHKNAANRTLREILRRFEVPQKEHKKRPQKGSQKAHLLRHLLGYERRKISRSDQRFGCAYKLTKIKKNSVYYVVGMGCQIYLKTTRQCLVMLYFV